MKRLWRTITAPFRPFLQAWRWWRTTAPVPASHGWGLAIVASMLQSNQHLVRE